MPVSLHQTQTCNGAKHAVYDIIFTCTARLGNTTASVKALVSCGFQDGMALFYLFSAKKVGKGR